MKAIADIKIAEVYLALRPETTDHFVGVKASYNNEGTYITLERPVLLRIRNNQFEFESLTLLREKISIPSTQYTCIGPLTPLVAAEYVAFLVEQEEAEIKRSDPTDLVSAEITTVI